MDKFSSLKMFVQVVESGGFAAAARDTGASRSQTNKLVIALEDQLGVQLLNRTTRSVSTTAAGLAFYERVQGILSDLSEAESAIQEKGEEPMGSLRINAPMSFGTLHLGPAIADFMTMYPQLKVQLELSDRFIDPVSEGFDITVRIAEPIENLSLVDHTIVEAKRLICASPEFLATYGHPESIKDLASLPCLHYGTLPAGSVWKLASEDGQFRDTPVNGVLCSNNAEVLRDAALRGLGFALLPTFIAGSHLQSGRLVSVLSQYRAPPIHLCLIYPPNRHLSSRTRRFVEFMYDRFGDLPHWDLVD
ncbi:MAG: LysR family transcriptional regulator [Parasphingorhabdus sp.]